MTWHIQPSEYRVRVAKDQLVFSAGHFITFAGGICERVHGHNWRVAVEVIGPLDENHYVFDFIALRDTLAALVGELDHRMLLPTEHPAIQLEISEVEVIARHQNRRWVFPRDECVLLSVPNTTAEALARWLGEQFLARADPAMTNPLRELRMDVEENFGQIATCVFRQPV